MTDRFDLAPRFVRRCHVAAAAGRKRARAQTRISNLRFSDARHRSRRTATWSGGGPHRTVYLAGQTASTPME